MTHLRKRMLEELQRRNYSDSTARGYLSAVVAFGQYFGKSPDQLGPDHLRRYEAYLLKRRKLAVGTVIARVAALRFFFVRTLKRHEFRQDLPYPKKQGRLPTVLSLEEVGQLIDAAGNLQQRAVLMILYGTGMRRAEVSRLKVTDVDGRRMIIRVECGKGGHDRDLPLSPALLETLREYWRWKKPRTYLFPSRNGHRGKDQPMSEKSVWYACTEAARHGALPSALRHTLSDIAGRPTCWKQAQICERFRSCSAMETWKPLPSTFHLSQRHLHAVANPLDQLPISSVKESNREYHRKKKRAGLRWSWPISSAHRAGAFSTSINRVSDIRSSRHFASSKTAALQRWVDISMLVRSAASRPSPTTPAVTGTARSARRKRVNAGWQLASAKVLPTSYFHVVFSVPHELDIFALEVPRALYDLLFTASTASALEMAASPERSRRSIQMPKSPTPRTSLPRGYSHCWACLEDYCQSFHGFFLYYPSRRQQPAGPFGFARRPSHVVRVCDETRRV